MESGLRDWWNSVPIVTKWLFACSFGLTLAGNFGLVNPMLIILDWNAVIYNLQLWRLITCFFFHGRLGFNFLIHMLFLVRYGQSLEQTVFFGRTADYLFFLMFGGSLLLIASFFIQLPILGMSLIMMLIYLWSRKNPNLTMSFMFGIRFQSFYFPWVLVAFSVLMGGFPLAEVVGILVGHIYFYLDEIYPATGGQRYLKTPHFLNNFFPPQQFGRPPSGQQQQQQQGGHNWGRGFALGAQ